jgi:hypothetical protein
MSGHRALWLVGLLLSLSACAGALGLVLLWKIWRSGRLAQWVFLGAILLRASAPLPPPTRLFREHILDPIPESVREIKVDRAREVFGYGYVFSFRIDKADLESIIRSRPYTRRSHVYYAARAGEMVEMGDMLPILTIYPPREKKPPAWWIPERVRDLDAYVYRETKDGNDEYTWMLLYNEEFGEAYFLAFKET